MFIRQENSGDYEEVYQLIQKAFASAEHSDGNEQDLVAALRKGPAFVPELSLVAELDRQIIGHSLWTEAKVGQDTVLVLAPLSVLPEFQRKGVGAALIGAGHTAARALGYSYSLVLGSETYYPRFGYLPAEQFGIEVPDGMPSVNFMALKLLNEAKPVCGAVMYAKEFGI